MNNLAYRPNKVKVSADVKKATSDLMRAEKDIGQKKRHPAKWYRAEVAKQLRLNESSNPSLRSYEVLITELRGKFRVVNPLDAEWHLGTLDKYPLTPAGVARILDYKLKAKRNNTDWVSVRLARWMDRLSNIYVLIDGQQKPISADNLSFLATLYAGREYEQELLGEDYSFSPKFDDDNIFKLLQEHPLEMTEENFTRWEDTDDVKVEQNPDGTATVKVRMTPEEHEELKQSIKKLEKQERKGGKS